MPIHFTIKRDGNNFSCSADGGAAFFVGRRVPFEGNIGLFNIFAGTKIEKLDFSPKDFPKHGFWSLFIEPTALCEGRNFLTLNTYDRAHFTFGFGQFAAHVPDGDFVQYFRTMLKLPEAADYFPHLALVNKRICNDEGGPQPVPLETADSTERLMRFLNPDVSEVQDSEVIAAAKLIHWTSRSAAARNAQVEQMVRTYKDFMARADKRVGIDNRPATECCVIADILHHGRGGKMTWPLISEALASNKPFDSLIAIGAPKWESRKQKLREAIKARPDFAARRWSSKKGDFV